MANFFPKKGEFVIMYIENSLVISIIHDYGVERYSSKKTPFHPIHNKFKIYFGRMKYYETHL